MKAVKERLTAEIQYWNFRAADLKQKEAAGKIIARHNSQRAARRAEELEARMQKRLAGLEAEKLISAMPPLLLVVRGHAAWIVAQVDWLKGDLLEQITIAPMMEPEQAEASFERFLRDDVYAKIKIVPSSIKLRF